MTNSEKLPKSISRGVMRGVVRSVLKPILGTTLPVSIQRRAVSAITVINRPPRGASSTAVDMNGVPALCSKADSLSKQSEFAILYLHGGAYVLGGPEGYRNVTGHLAIATQAQVFCVDYRMAPEHPFPAAIDDAITAYQWLLAQGYAPEKIAIGGDSAGGGLTLATALRLRDENLPLPAALLLISPWVDLTLSGESVHIKARVDAMLRQRWLERSAKQYMGSAPLDTPGGSPLFADLKGLPPLIMHTGQDEILLDDSTRLAERARAADVAVYHKVFTDLWHVFHLHAGIMPESATALDDLSSQLLKAWK